MSKKKDIKIIPSPFPVVTEFEDQFVQAGMKTIAGAVKEVLQYVAEQQKELNK